MDLKAGIQLSAIIVPSHQIPDHIVYSRPQFRFNSISNVASLIRNWKLTVILVAIF